MSEPAVTPRRKRRWLRRLGGGVLLIILLLLVFHRPILRQTVRWVAGSAAKDEKLTLTWEVEGSVVSDVNLTNVRIAGGPDHWLREAAIGQLSADYDLWKLWRAGLAEFLGGVKLHDVSATLDLRRLPAGAREPSAPGSPSPPPWPRSLDLENVSLELTLADGARLVVQNLTLKAGEGQPGTFSCAAVRIEPDGLRVENLAGDAELTPGRFALRNLTGIERVRVDELRADLTQFTAGRMDFLLAASQDAARLKAEVSLTGLHSSAAEWKGTVHGENLRSDSLGIPGLAKAVQFSGAMIDLNFTGQPDSPQGFDAAVKIAADELAATGVTYGRTQLDFITEKGEVQLRELNAVNGPNTVKVSGRATLPAAWDEMGKMTWQATADISAADPARIMPELKEAAGSLTVSVTGRGNAQEFPSLAATLTGRDLRWQSFRLTSLDAGAATDGRGLKIDSLTAVPGDGNRVTLSGVLDWNDDGVSKFDWQAALDDPQSALQHLNVSALPGPLAGIVRAQGKAEFVVTDFAKARMDRLSGDAVIDAQSLRYGGAAAGRVSATARCEAGTLTLERGKVELDSANTLEVRGSLNLAGARTFSVTAKAGLPQLTALNPLLAELGAPAIESGGMELDVTGSGELEPLRYAAAANVTATRLRTAEMTEPLDLHAVVHADGPRAEVSELKAVLGPWRLSAAGRVDERRIEMDRLRLWQGDLLLVEGRAKMPLMAAEADNREPVDVQLKAKDVPLGKLLAAAGWKDAPTGVLGADVTLTGPVAAASGTLEVTLRDIRVPAAAKQLKPASLTMKASLANNKLTAQAIARQPPLQPLTVNASLPLDLKAVIHNPDVLLEAPVTADANMPESRLDFVRDFAPKLLKSTPGRASVSARVRGPLRAPRVEGSIRVTAPVISFVSPDMPSIRDAAVRLDFSPQQVATIDAGALVSGGRVRLNGTARLPGSAAAGSAARPSGPANPGLLYEPLVDLRLSASQALVQRDRASSLRANAELLCRGPLATAHVSGAVEAVRGRFFKEVEFLPLSLPDDLPPLPPAVDSASASTLPLPPQVADWTFDVKVTTRDPVRISGNVLNGGVVLDAHLGGTGRAPLLTGSAQFDEASVQLPFSRMKVTRGLITLDPARPLDPQLDVRAESHAGQYDITLYLFGSALDPKTRFVSVPPLPEPDIAALLATGTTLGGSDREVGSEVASRAAFLLLSEAYRKLFRKGKAAPAEPPRLRVGFDPAPPRSRSGGAGVTATYDITPKIQAEALVSSEGNVRALLNYLVRFGSPGDPPGERRRP